MKYRQNLSIILMPDKGQRCSYTVRRGRFVALLLFFACLPLVSGLLGWQCWKLWEENAALRRSVLRFESDWQAAQATAERLENLEELLREENVQSRETVLRRLAAVNGLETPPPAENAGGNGNDNAGRHGDQPRNSGNDGPGHEEFPAIDTDYVKVSNVQARALRGGKLRIALDLRNTDNQKIASGTVAGILITADGARHTLEFDPPDMRNFRISRFKRAVVVVRLPHRPGFVNSQVILEVRNAEDVPVYRSIFAVEH